MEAVQSNHKFELFLCFFYIYFSTWMFLGRMFSLKTLVGKGMFPKHFSEDIHYIMEPLTGIL